MAVEIKMPALSPTMEEGTLAKWHVKAGDTVVVNQTIVEIETAKAAVELPCPFAGTVTEVFEQAGERRAESTGNQRRDKKRALLQHRAAGLTDVVGHREGFLVHRAGHRVGVGGHHDIAGISRCSASVTPSSSRKGRAMSRKRCFSRSCARVSAGVSARSAAGAAWSGRYGRTWFWYLAQQCGLARRD